MATSQSDEIDDRCGEPHEHHPHWWVEGQNGLRFHCDGLANPYTVLHTPKPPGPETCPSLCVERSHPGREHDEAEHGCFCWELCAMGPTCPGANAGLDRGCWRVKADQPIRPEGTSDDSGA